MGMGMAGFLHELAFRPLAQRREIAQAGAS
jgi:hypothetical protein